MRADRTRACHSVMALQSRPVLGDGRRGEAAQVVVGKGPWKGRRPPAGMAVLSTDVL